MLFNFVCSYLIAYQAQIKYHALFENMKNYKE